MRHQLTVFGGGSLIGKSLCRRAVRLGWDVNAFSIEDIRPKKFSLTLICVKKKEK